MKKYTYMLGCALLISCFSDNVNTQKREVPDQSLGSSKKSSNNQNLVAPDFNVAFRPALSPIDVSNLSVSGVKKLYADLLVQDQQYRDSIHAPGMQSSDQYTKFSKAYRRADSLNQLILSALLGEFGWPTIKRYGVKSAHAAFLITWHADEQYKKRQLPLLQKAAQQDTHNLHYYKVLTDRIQIGDGKKQQFGTHRRLSNGTYQVNF